VVETAEQVHAQVVNTGRKLHLPQERFPDFYHLDQSGARVFTGEIVKSLERLVKTSAVSGE